MKILSLFSANSGAEIQDLAESLHNSDDSYRVLTLVVKKIARAMETDVCSLYLLESATKKIVLAATHGLNPTAVGKVRMDIGEGLVGKTVEWMKPISMARGKKSRLFKYFPETGEEKFSSFLSVPLIDKRTPVGVLVVQNKKATRFSNRSANLLMTLAGPTLKVIEKVKLLGTLSDIDAKKREGERGEGSPISIIASRRHGIIHKGIGASPGIAIARVVKMAKTTTPSAPLVFDGPVDAKIEKGKVADAFKAVAREVRDTVKKAQKKFGMEELAIFDAYLTVLESDAFLTDIYREIDQGREALRAIEGVVQRFTGEIDLSTDDYIRERAYDIRDIGRKLADYLVYGKSNRFLHRELEEASILLSDFWSISDFVEMDLEKTKGILSASGGASSHIAILAESLGLPAVLGLASYTASIQEGDLVILDGSSGIVIVNPDDRTLEIYNHESRVDGEAMASYRKGAKKRAGPKGGSKITFGANLGMLAHVRMALENGAEEIGLYRTEFPFLIRKTLPTEEEQFVLYRKVLETMEKRPVTIRVLDIGGDKYLPYLNLPREANPFLGWRSIRIFMEREDLFRIQLRALLRASVYGHLRILFPMISSLDEIRWVKEVLQDVKAEFKKADVAVASDIPIGLMIEVPSSVEIASSLIREVDFFSIGTNDLTQYTLAVDRNNTKVAGLFNSFHPALLRMIQRTIFAAHAERKMISVCGEMASQPAGVVLLLGMGIDSLSMSAPLISKIKSFVSRLEKSKITSIARQALKLDSAKAIQGLVDDFIRNEGLTEYLPHPTPTI